MSTLLFSKKIKDWHSIAWLFNYNSINLILSDEFRILLDMRWNKQYLEILGRKGSFEKDEQYSELLEAMSAVANR